MIPACAPGNATGSTDGALPLPASLRKRAVAFRRYGKKSSLNRGSNLRKLKAFLISFLAGTAALQKSARELYPTCNYDPSTRNHRRLDCAGSLLAQQSSLQLSSARISSFWRSCIRALARNAGQSSAAKPDPVAAGRAHLAIG